MTLNVMFKLSNIWFLECNTMLLSNCGKKYTIIFKLWIRTRSYIYIMNHGFTFNFFSNKTKFAWYIFAVRCFLLTEIIKRVPFIRKTPETPSFPLLELCFNENTVKNRQKHQERNTAIFTMFATIYCLHIVLWRSCLYLYYFVLWIFDCYIYVIISIFYRFCLLVYWWF
jgi:hypothetical protein